MPHAQHMDDLFEVPESIHLGRCPWCGVARPGVSFLDKTVTYQTDAGRAFVWARYECNTCHAIITAWQRYLGSPRIQQVGRRAHRGTFQLADRYNVLPEAPGRYPVDIPERTRDHLREARETVETAPGLSILGSAAAIDRMLKERGLKEGSLSSRLKQARDDHILMPELYKWAAHIKDQGNDERHSDLDALPATPENARACFEFAEKLAEIWFVLPAELERKQVE